MYRAILSYSVEQRQENPPTHPPTYLTHPSHLNPRPPLENKQQKKTGRARVVAGAITIQPDPIPTHKSPPSKGPTQLQPSFRGQADIVQRALLFSLSFPPLEAAQNWDYTVVRAQHSTLNAAKRGEREGITNSKKNYRCNTATAVRSKA